MTGGEEKVIDFPVEMRARRDLRSRATLYMRVHTYLGPYH